MEFPSGCELLWVMIYARLQLHMYRGRRVVTCHTVFVSWRPNVAVLFKINVHFNCHGFMLSLRLVTKGIRIVVARGREPHGDVGATSRLPFHLRRHTWKFKRMAYLKLGRGVMKLELELERVNNSPKTLIARRGRRWIRILWLREGFPPNSTPKTRLSSPRKRIKTVSTYLHLQDVGSLDLLDDQFCHAKLFSLPSSIKAKSTYL